MGRARPYLSSKELLLLYNTLVLPHLNYCAVVWGGAYHSRLKKITILQKTAVMIIDHKPFLFPSIKLFVKYNMLKIKELVSQQCIVILLAYLNGNLPVLMSDLFKINKPLNTRAPDHFVVPFSRCNFRTFSLSITAPIAWNSIICSMLPQLDDVPRGKTALKNHVKAVT